ncbi:MAG: DUF952 domain-containing protein [Bdellovibrionota bacterium]
MKVFLLSLVFFGAVNSEADVYHLISEGDLKQRTQNGFIFEPSLKTEGFAHCATLLQIIPVTHRHYKGVKDLLLLKIEERYLIYPLRYDYVAKHATYFPHIYGPINLSAVKKVFKMQINSDGSFRLPKDI